VQFFVGSSPFDQLEQLRHDARHHRRVVELRLEQRLGFVKKMTDRALLRAASNSSPSSCSVSRTISEHAFHFDGQKRGVHFPAIARATNVLPVPGGPYINTPDPGWMRIGVDVGVPHRHQDVVSMMSFISFMPATSPAAFWAARQ